MSIAEKRYAKPWVLGLVEAALGIFGVVALVAGPAYWVNGLTQAGALVRVPVALSAAGADQLVAPGERPAVVDLPLPDGLVPAAVAAQVSLRLEVPNSDLELRAHGRATVGEWALARGDALLQWTAAGASALALRRLVMRVGRGEPFAPGGARCFAVVAGAVAVASYAAPLLPAAAAARVLARLGLDGPGSPLVVSTSPLDLAPLLVIGLLLALAEAFRQGEKLARDAEGLV